MNIDERINYYSQIKWCITFRDLKHSVYEVCELVKPIIPNIEPNKYLAYFLANIDFDNIDNNPNREIGLKNCTLIYFGLDQLLKIDIDKGISEFQLNLSSLNSFQTEKIQNGISDIIGLLERQKRTNVPGISFAKRFNAFYKSVEKKQTIFLIHYQQLISEFNEVIINDLLSSYKILNKTINSRIQLSVEQRIRMERGSKKINWFVKQYNSKVESLKPFLLSKDIILPKDVEEFLFWLLNEKYKQDSLHPLPEIIDNDFFEFSKYRKSQLDTIVSEHLPHQNAETKTELGIPAFTNNFDNIKPTEIYKHFKAMLVEKEYLTETELNEYLKAAFELKTKPETLFKLKHTPTKQKIYTVFYVYYKDIAQKKHERQKEYAALLGDYFEGYKTEIIQTNWARDYKTKR